ncbi:MAG: PorT family protein [Flavobacteriales bacterium]|nr:PorT family protein [Flavobacteriales bacterium]
MKKQLIIVFLLCLTGGLSFSQQGNYPTFDRKKVHFGFALGVNTADFHYRLHPSDSLTFDSIQSISIRRQPGFNLGIIGSWDIHETVHLRFIPSLSFSERLFQYEYFKNGELKTRENRLESTNLDFPILLKLRTKRIINFAAYAIGGMQYSLDLASQNDVEQLISDPIVKIKKHDFAYQVGGGFDFWLPYFKFGIELKLSNGIRNVAIQDGTFFMRPLESLRNKIWWFSLTFEG